MRALLQILSLLWGVMAILSMMVGFVPLLGALNWIIIPFSGTGLIFSAVAIVFSSQGKRTGSIIGLVFCGIAVLFGIGRLMLGGGLL